MVELLEDPDVSDRPLTVDLVVQELRRLAVLSLDENKTAGSIQMLRRIVRLFSKSSIRKLVDVPSEFLLLIQNRARDAADRATYCPSVQELIQFLTEEAIAGDVLKTLLIGMSEPVFAPEVLAMVQKLLIRGATLGQELSSSLYRVRQARKRFVDSEARALYGVGGMNATPVVPSSIWTRMARGDLPLDK